VATSKPPTLGRVIDKARDLRWRAQVRINDATIRIIHERDRNIDKLISELCEEDRDAARQVLDVDVPMPEGE
jgi:hypothetical protein